MACTPLVVTPGLFINVFSTAWSSAPSTSMGGKTVTRTAAGISVSGPTGTMPFHSTVAGRISEYMFFGTDNFLLLLDSETGGGAVTHSVSLVDFTTTPPTERPLFSVLTSGTGVPPPNVQFSQGSGSAFCIFASTGTNISNLAIYRSDSGVLLCAGPPPFSATGQTEGEATATDVKIHYSTGGASQVTSCPLPASNLTVQPLTQTFPDVVIGGCPMPPSMKQFTLRNTGNDCLTVNAIGIAPPFSVTATSKPLPATLLPGQTMTVTVTFSPAAVGTFGPTNLPVTRTPARGDDKLVCSGKARAPIRKIGFNQTTIDFGSWPVGTPAPSQSLLITNTGEAAINVSLPGSPAGSPLQWAAFSGTLNCGAPPQPVPINFLPAAVGVATTTISVTSNTPTSPNLITLVGRGCDDPPGVGVTPASINFGAVPLQFFIGRRITVANTGPCLSLSVTLHTAGAPFFVTDTDPTSVSPTSVTVSAVIPRGTSKRFVVVFAPSVLGAATGSLTVTHNDPTQATVVVPLSGNGVTLVPAAWELVLDRSGSMAAPAIGGTKMDALKAAVHLFADLVIPGRGDEMGSVEFDDVADVITSPGGYDLAKQQAIKADADALTPRNRTSIGGGLQLGQSEISGSAVARKVMLVFTDGLQNTPPSITTAEPGILSAGTEVYAIGLGQPPNISVEDLTALAATAGGRFFLTDDALVLRKFFIQVLADAYRNNMAQDPVLTLNQGSPVEIPVNITECELRISFILNWDDPNATIDFTVRAPDGTLLTLASPLTNQLVRFGQRPGYRYYQIVFPPIDPGSGLVIGPPQLGKWIMRIDPVSLPGGTQRCTTSVMVESQLALRTIVHAVDNTMPLQVRAELLNGGVPVDTARVMLTLVSPLKSLAQARTPAVLNRAINADANPIPTGEPPLIPTQTTQHRLLPGNRGFELELPPREIDGVYDFNIQATGESCGGSFERFETFSMYIGPRQRSDDQNHGR